MSGAIIYKGPSLFDGEPIVAVAIASSSNRKTGDMVQTYILRSDLNPLEANKLGEDASICGNCKHRGTPTLDPERKLAERRSCYVNMGQGPLVVWRNYLAGKYPVAHTREARAALGAGRLVRIGTYGDGAAVPDDIWRDILSHASGHTAYTHSGGDPQRYMQSADNLHEARQFWIKGYRTFRILGPGDTLEPAKEALCPASKEAGYRTTCESCLLCGGANTRAKSIAIHAHGTGAGYLRAQ